MTTSSIQFIPAGDIAIGDAIVEQDGYLWAVTAIERKGSMVTFSLANDFSPCRAWRTDGAGMTFRKRASTKVACVRGAGSSVVPSLAQVAS